jgi:competence protein ComEC
LRQREPLLFPFGIIAAGVVAATYQRLPLDDALCAGVGCALIAFGAARKRLRTTWFASGAALAFFGFALVAMHPQHSPPTLSVPDNVPTILAGCVVDPALVAADRERFTVELAPGARSQVSLYEKPGESFPRLPYGTQVEFTGKVRTPHNYNNPGSFDNTHYLARQHIFWSASADVSSIHTVPGRCGDLPERAIFGIRMAALDRLDSLYANDAYSNGMMQAVLIGATAKLERMWTEDYRSTGTFHALVISGGHVAVLAAVLLFFLRICCVPKSWAMVATIAMAWLYAGITGYQAPVLRSAAGMTLFGVGRLFYREGRLLNILAAVALLFLVVEPEQLFDASFQLSFLAVALIGAFVVPALNRTSGPLTRGLEDLGDVRRDPRLQPRSAQFRVEMRLLAETLRTVAGVPERAALWIVAAVARVCLYFWEIFVASFFIQVGVALPMICYFHRVPVSGLTANAIVVPALSAVVPLGFLAIALNSHPLAAVCAWLLQVARQAAAFHARWEPGWRIPTPPWWLGALLVAALIVAALRGTRRVVRAAAWVAAAVALVAIIVHPFAPVVEPRSLEVSAIDVGQGDSLLAAFPDGRLMLIDAGGIPSFGRTRKPGIDIGEDVVSNYLWTRSIKRLDVVVMTHAHEDHMGGMSSVLRNFRPKELWTGAVQESPEWIGVRATSRELGIPIREMKRCDPFGFGGATITVLAPDAGYEPGEQPKNDDSLVMRFEYGSTSFLMTGDMEKKIEEQLYYSGLLRHADVLKVGHHGSRTSSGADLLDTVRPEFGVISAGFENSYGHPHPLTLDALQARHVAVYRTDERGLVRIVSDGKRIHIE